MNDNNHQQSPIIRGDIYFFADGAVISGRGANVSAPRGGDLRHR
ncbi:MAG: hypothetical protein VYB10_00080 [Actinomycetota bacterium]|nr:hypothetical protein [Actinomycetota bacterium]